MGSRIGSHFNSFFWVFCLGPVLGSRFGPKSGVSHQRGLLLPAEILQADLRRTSMSVSVNTCFFSLCVPLCFLYSRGPFLAAMFLLVFWIAPRLTEACSRHAWQELLWKKPPLRTSTCGRQRFRRNHPFWEPRMWQGQVWEARPDGESTRGKAKFGKRHGSRKWEEENSATRIRHRGKGQGRLLYGRRIAFCFGLLMRHLFLGSFTPTDF